jgi:hypothetical protein
MRTELGVAFVLAPDRNCAGRWAGARSCLGRVDELARRAWREEHWRVLGYASEVAHYSGLRT